VDVNDERITTVNELHHLLCREKNQMNRNRPRLLALELAEESSHYEISVLHCCSSLAECMKLLISFEYSALNWPASPWKGLKEVATCSAATREADHQALGCVGEALLFVHQFYVHKSCSPPATRTPLIHSGLALWPSWLAMIRTADPQPPPFSSSHPFINSSSATQSLH